ncbi:MAG TPA: hypothetical protein PKD55_01905 [Bellilinea sp.]|nr:hypothetical protein [Bellilinea sp.]
MTKLIEVYRGIGRLDAEILAGVLKGFDIESTILQEAAGEVYGLTIGQLGNAIVYVSETDEELASKIVLDYLERKYDSEWGEESDEDQSDSSLD